MKIEEDKKRLDEVNKSFEAKIDTLNELDSYNACVSHIKQDDGTDWELSQPVYKHVLSLMRDTLIESGFVAKELITLKRGCGEPKTVLKMATTNMVEIFNKKIPFIKQTTTCYREDSFSQICGKSYWVEKDLGNVLRDDYVVDDNGYCVKQFLEDLGCNYYSIVYGGKRTIETNEDAKVMAYGLCKMAKYGVIIFKTKRVMLAYEFTLRNGYAEGTFTARCIELEEALKKIEQLKQEVIEVVTPKNEVTEIRDKILLQAI